MPIYSYIVLDQRGNEQHGQMEASDMRAAGNALRDQSLFVVSIEPGDAISGASFASRDWRKLLAMLSPRQYMPVKNHDLIFLFRQLALMLRAGHTVVQALEANREMTSKYRLRRTLLKMSESIQSGESFSHAVAAQKSVFPSVVYKLLAAGERSGDVDVILVRLAEDLERRQDVKRELAAALTYPGIVFFMALAVSISLVTVVIPKFAEFLTRRGKEMPPVTQFLLDLADWFEVWGLMLAVAVALLIFGVLVAMTTRVGKKIVDGFILKIPVIGKVISSSGMAQATWALSMQLNSGIALLASLRIVRDLLGNRVLADAFGDAGEKILAGQSLSVALKNPAIPDLVRHMSAIGESSGELEGVMDALGIFYQKDLQGRVKTLSAWVEPLMILIVGGMVGTVYLAFFQAAMATSTR